ncbi:universal stress protein family protein [Micromonospora pisi]|uniref:Universal stress protein family protein n=1 Tax=Micromonospora pisi TaxID=589240 RepID=A0A495JD38_9ACTN|nr:universal stress protein [Micromonospora pisi]RKR86835.1 universal stress protein family protein [Micromonospora pisi]
MDVTAAAGRVVVGVDASIGGLQALRFAVTQARVSHRPLRAVRAWSGPTTWRDPARMVERWRDELARGAHRYVMSAFVTALGSVPDDVVVDVAVPEGDPGPSLLGYAASEADLLVVGGRSARFGRSTGPVTRYCLARARVPIVVVPAPGWVRAATIRRVAHEIERDLERLSRRPLA